jgi:predicted AAA+ superfamily ATPase
VENNRYIPRTMEEVLSRAVAEFPAVVLTGPRQSGKTTLLKHLFAKTHRYVSLEPPDIQAIAKEDPRGFMDMYSPPAIFDEIQYAPDLLPYVKERVDAEREKRGQFLLTGSQNLLLMQEVTESLAGRAATLRLLPFSWCEISGRPQALLPWESKERKIEFKPVPYLDLWKSFLRGSYPELVAYPGRDIHLWHGSYTQTYLERDVRTLRQVGDLTQFQIFLRALAARSAQLLHLSNLARDLGVAVNTVKAWISVLEATYQIIILRPYFTNVGKRLVKTPKVYFTDVGTLCYLAGLRDAEHAAYGPMGGAIIESAVVSEIVKRFVHLGVEPQIYFWQTSAGTEVDIVVDTGEILIPIEVKFSATPRPAMISGIKAFRKDLGNRTAPGYLIHAGETRLPLGSEVMALPFSEL